MSVLTFAAIDVGSDPVRCHIAEVDGTEGDLLLERCARAREFRPFEEVFGLKLRLEKG